MSSSVGYVPTDGGDFLPYIIEIRKIIERPKLPQTSEIDDFYDKAAEIQKLKSGHGYTHDENYNLTQYDKNSGKEDYYTILSRGDPKWAFSFVLREASSYPHNGLNIDHIEELYEKGYGSIKEMLEAPDEVLLSLNGIGKKKLERIRSNLKN